MVKNDQQNGTDAKDGREAAALAVVRGLVNHTILSKDWPVVSIVRYRRDCKTSKLSPDVSEFGTGSSGGIRGVITEFSERSRYRFLHFVKNCDCDFASMITLTYPKEFPTNGKEVKQKHFKAFRQWFLRTFPLDSGCWFLEFQRRGAPHFHILISTVLSDYGPVEEKRRLRFKNGNMVSKSYETNRNLEKVLAKKWFEIVASGDPKHLKAGVAWETLQGGDGALKYAACHASKPHQKEVPVLYRDVGNFWGKLGNISCEPIEEIFVDSTEVFRVMGPDALTRKGRVKKYLWDSSEMFKKAANEKE